MTWRDDVRVLRRLLALFAPWRRWMIAGAAVALLALLANVALLAVAGDFIASMALAGAAAVAINYFTPAAMIRGAAIARTAGRYVERLLTHEATFRLLAHLRLWFYRRIEPLAPERLQRWRSADLMSRMLADIETLNQVYLRLFVPLAVGVAGSVLALSVMALYSRAVAASTAALLVVAGVVLPALLRRRGAPAAARQLQLRTQLRVDVADALAGAAELRVYGGEARALQRVNDGSEALLGEQRRLADLAGLAAGGVGLCANMALWFALLWALPQVAARQLAPAHLAMLALFALAVFEAVAPLPLAFQLLGEMLAAARRLFELADIEPPPQPALSPRPRDAGIVLRDVRLRYADDAPWALDGIDLELAAGARLALVGASGAGKSSVVQLLARFRDYAGSARVGGHELRDYAGDDARALLAVVSQDDYLFHGTLLDNLLLARPDASEAQIVDACRCAQLHDFINGLPDGYHSSLGEGGMLLSGGQARRLALARALLKDAPILILDEPTEGLDAATERDLFAALAQAMAGRTVLLISHRLGALAALVDEVAVLHAGRVVQRGSAAELATQPGPYAALRELYEPA
jgi:ATP-binding cassette subfamily C protein CydC